MIKLGRLRVDNFKSFLQAETFSLSQSDVIILDGPNGFGKTTLFDAIELCFREEIGRILTTDTKVKNNHLLKNKPNLATNIFLELTEDKNTKAVIFIHIPANTSTTENKLSACQVQRQILDDWPENFENNNFDTRLNVSTSLENIIENEQLKNTFNIFNYIQQEETCHFLKQKEADRHKQLSYLFGTLRETIERDKFKVIQTELKKKYDDITKRELKECEDSLIKLKETNAGSFERFKGKGAQNSGKNELFDQLDNISFDKLNNYTAHLNTLKWLLINPEKYSVILINHQIEVMTNNRVQELEDLIIVGSTLKYDEILKLNKHMSWLVKLENKMSNFQRLISQFENNPDLILNGDNTSYLKYFTKYFILYQPKLANYQTLIKRNGSYKKILHSINLNRHRLIEEYTTHIEEHSPEKKVTCPLCGIHKASIDVLLTEYEEQTKSIDTLLGDSSKELKLLSKDLTQNLLYPIVQKAKKFITKYQEFLSLKNILTSRQVSFARWDGMNKVKAWLNKNSIDYNRFIQPYLLKVNDTPNNQNLADLTNLIRSHSKEADDIHNYQFLQASLNSLRLLFRNNELLNEKGGVLTVADLDLDIDFIEFKKLQILSLENNRLEKNIANKKKQADLLNTEFNKIKGIVRVYSDKIKEYEQKVAQQIAIPFYIYSSKILQTRPEGNGVFLKTSATARENGYIKFTSTATDDHDAWNTMSSGQLSGLVISFMLAMNKVYPSNLATLLIDDPVQTMDEINMASFIQLLKYDFTDKQLILSTHEKKVSDYLSFKYLQSDLKVTSINLKNRRLNRE